MKSWRTELRMQKGLTDLCEVLRRNLVRFEYPLTLVEVGSAAGESLRYWRTTFDRVYCVDLWEEPFEQGPEAETYFDQEMVVEHFNCNDLIKIKKSSEDASKDFDVSQIDMVYLDADHSYESVKGDIDFWLPKATQFIGGHDYNVLNHPQVVQAVNEKFLGPDYVFLDDSWLVKLDRKRLIWT